MTEYISPKHSGGPGKGIPFLDSFARRVVWKRMEALREGTFVLRDGEETRSFGETNQAALHAELTVLHPSVYRKLLFGGSVGAAESYMQGDWTSPHLPTLIRLLLRNMTLLRRMDSGWARMMMAWNHLYHIVRRNTRMGSRRNIHAHYDLGNDFYALFLDETMTYSCGYFEKKSSSLREASLSKYDRICRKLDLRPYHHVLEIGGGWGGFAVYAAKQYGCRITTTTISKAQADYARKLVSSENLEGQVEIVEKDYRDLTGLYDRAVSIEMIEAVGNSFLKDFFRSCSDALKPDGMMALQAITIPDSVYPVHRRQVDFIKRYIFPGSCIPSLAVICDAVARVTDLRLVHLEDITLHYARTLRAWRNRFFENLESVKALGFPPEFVRMWEFYLSYCEGSFAERYNGDVQIIFAKPACRSMSVSPGAGRAGFNSWPENDSEKQSTPAPSGIPRAQRTP